MANRCSLLRYGCNVIRQRFGESAAVTRTKDWKVFWWKLLELATRLLFPPVALAQIVQLACLEPIAKGLHLTHWSSEDLARQAVIDGIVTEISARTVRCILHGVNLQPHSTRYWKTAHIDLNSKSRAEQILWCYDNANQLMGKGFFVVCADEMPNLQALERRPIRRAIPGSIEQQEFEYVRHGTVNALLFLTVPTGQMHVRYPHQKDAAHYIEALKWFHHSHQHLRGAFLIQDGDPGHTAAQTKKYFQLTPWWRSRFTPAHASWLNQGELLNHAFSQRYLRRASWISREALITHIDAASTQYNQRYAHPFEWTWTNQQMRNWFVRHAPDKACK